MSVRPKFCSTCGEKLDTDIDIEECPKCHSPIHEHSGHTLPPSSIIEDLPHKSPRKVTIIAIIGGLFGIQGLGHIYVGKLGKGFGILSTGIGLLVIPLALGGYLSFFLPDEVALHPLALSYDNDLNSLYFLFGIVMIVFAIGYLLLFIWQVFDARKLAKKFNALVKATGKEPW
jgi:TM2 domain-containing membrane protein YozV